MAASKNCLFKTGSVPGMPRQIGQVLALAGLPNSVEQEQKIFVFVFYFWCCTGSLGFRDAESSPIACLPVLGFGLALQPLVKVIINGFIFDGTHIPKSDRVIDIKSKNVKGVVNTVGMLHSWIEDSDGHLIMVSNNILGEEPIKIYKRKPTF